MSNPNPETQPIAQVIDEVQREAALAKPGAPIEVRLETGQVYRGNTPQELVDTLARAQTEASRTITAERRQVQELQGQLSELQRQQQAPPVPANADTARLQEYYNTWATNPDKAATLQLARMLNVPEDRVVGVLRQAIEGHAVNSAADEFLGRCPDFPQTPQTAALVRDELARRYGTGVEAASADHLELVFHDLVRNGKIQPAALPTGVNDANRPIPNIRGGSAPPNPVQDILARAREMPLDQLKQVIDRFASQNAR